MKKKAAVYTISKDEKFFLPIWINHYKQYFDISDIYVLDHDTMDGSTLDLDINVVPVHNHLSFDHRWLNEQVESFQRKLLSQYECVLFSEVDELVYNVDIPLNEYIDLFLASEDENVTCTGYEVMQNTELEKPLVGTENILEKRDYWFRYYQYDKTLLSKAPVYWCAGFHHCHVEKNFIPSLFLMHLQRCDLNQMIERRLYRMKNWEMKTNEPNDTAYYTAVNQMEEYFYNGVSRNGRYDAVESIPEQHKKALNHV